MLCSLLRLSCRKIGDRPGMDLILRRDGLILLRNGFQVIINDDFLEEGSVMADNSTLRIQLRQGVDSLAQW